MGSGPDGLPRSTGLNFYELFLYRYDTRGQSVETLSLMYVLLRNSGFGAVEWRGINSSASCHQLLDTLFKQEKNMIKGGLYFAVSASDFGRIRRIPMQLLRFPLE